MSLQDEPEVLLFKNYDSATDIAARNCLHTAFDLPPEEVPENAPTRESIEVRALVFTHPKGIRRPSGAEIMRQHPLAVQLEQENLKLVDDEHSITDRLRTDIDEGGEVKDAVLVLRRQQIRKLEIAREGLIIQRDWLVSELEQTSLRLVEAQEQINIQSAHADALRSKVRFLENQIEEQHSEHHDQIRILSKQLTDTRYYEYTRARNESDGIDVAISGPAMNLTEKVLLMERIDGLEQEVQKWKGEAMGKGNEAVSRSWQGSVDEAVRREREKDSFVIKALTEEIEKLRAGRANQASETF